ncbi:MAG: N-acetyltransferase [Hyphomicrobiaceae bacterium]|nr:MAG: N-acetyltransferase [Hyphomicrobiaceae bacterium]
MESKRVVPHLIRPRLEKDDGFLFKTWVTTQRRQGDRKHVTNRIYMSCETARIRSLLKRSTTIVACNVEDEEHIYGYLTFEQRKDFGPIAHYIFVKHSFQKLGLAKSLWLHAFGPNWAENGVRISDLSEPVLKLRRKYPLIYNPYLFFQES